MARRVLHWSELPGKKPVQSPLMEESVGCGDRRQRPWHEVAQGSTFLAEEKLAREKLAKKTSI